MRGNSFQSLTFILLPFCTNLSLLLFLIFSIDLFIAPSQPRNIIGIIGIYVYYIACLIMFFAYAYSTRGTSELFGSGTNKCLVFALMISYPIFFLFWLPYIMYQLMVYTGSPKLVWEKLFNGSVMSLERLFPDFNSNKCTLFGRYLYIGIPFFLFSLIYVLILIALSPLWYYLLSPLGLGTFGICLHVSLHFPHSTEIDLHRRMALTYRLGVACYVFAMDIPCIILAGVFIGLVAPEWHAILLLVASLLQFVVSIVPGTKDLCRSSGIDSL